MQEQQYDEQWSDRAARYPDLTPLPAGVTVHITVDPTYAKTYAGQVAAVTAASILGRMAKSVATQVPPEPVSHLLPWKGKTLNEAVSQTLADTHQYGQYVSREAEQGDLRVFIGPDGKGIVVHGIGWDAYSGTSSSHLDSQDDQNPFGAAFAAILAAARIQIDPEAAEFEPTTVDTYTWSTGIQSQPRPTKPTGFEMGQIWCVGVGSVGSCALFFLSLATQNFHAVLVDRDNVEVENVTRSALFTWQDASQGTPKVQVSERWLDQAGVREITAHNAWLHELSKEWVERPQGTPDILISAANEKNVRSTIENYLPPVQVYATTGKSWQATLLRHIPTKGPCSLCVPGSQRISAPLLCATGPSVNETAHEDDVALPFLSYAAGLMTAAEIAKLAITGKETTVNRVFFQPRDPDVFQVLALPKKQGCMCQTRDNALYRKSIEGSRFSGLSS